MAFIHKTADGLTFNTSCLDEARIIEKFNLNANEHGFDQLPITYGVNPSSDFGYFKLAENYWRTSLCIYMAGSSGCFMENGIGFTEPWLFNTRHSLELTVKGILLFSVWLQKVNMDLEESGYITSVKRLRDHFPKVHSLSDIYSEYKRNIQAVVTNWNTDISSDVPPVDKLLISNRAEDILNELNQIDPGSFTFRYPSLRHQEEDKIQQLGWRHDQSKLAPISGLPMESGYFFDHIKSINALHDLNSEFSEVKNFLGGIGCYIDDIQQFIWEHRRG